VANSYRVTDFEHGKISTMGRLFAEKGTCRFYAGRGV